MLKRRTKTEFPVYSDRGALIGNHIIRLIVDKLEIDINNVIYSGYYYRLGESGEVIILSKIGGLWQISDIEAAEPQLAALGSDIFCFQNVLQRLKEVNKIQMTQEAGQNFGTQPNDWEDDND